MSRPTSTAAFDDYPRRFGWGMRLFLSLFLFDMIFRGITWGLAEFGWLPADDAAPAPLPSRAELAAAEAGTHPAGYTTRGDCYTASLKSAGRFLRPWPDQAEREGIESAADAGESSVHWLMTRLQFLGHVAGVDQRWRMFGNVHPVKHLPGMRLIFADGSSRVVYGYSTPPDLSRFSRWCDEKRLQVELHALSSDDAKRGYANWLANAYPQSDAGATLTTIEFFKIPYERPPPGADVRADLQSRSDPLNGPFDPVIWRYDVATRTGRRVSDP